MLILKPNCECCDRDLAPDSADARICTFECTFCADCVETRLGGACPNCGGNFTRAPDPPGGAARQASGLDGARGRQARGLRSLGAPGRGLA